MSEDVSHDHGHGHGPDHGHGHSAGADEIPAYPADDAPPIPKNAPLRAADGVLLPINKSHYFSNDPDVLERVSAHIDEYFNQELHLFPHWENESKPDRFHVLFARQIEERFPIDAVLRRRIHDYGRQVFRALVGHVTFKRASQAASLVGLSVLARLGPTWFANWTGSEPIGIGLAVAAMLLIVGLFAAAQAIMFIQYRFGLENTSYEISREVVQQTRELQNLFTSARAMADQAETEYQMDGKGWGKRAEYLTRLTMWLGARMEYMEKYIQMELWRVRRERYWMRWVQRFLTPLVLLVWFVLAALEPAPRQAAPAFWSLQVLSLILAVAISWLSYFRWRTPATSAIKDKLGTESWVRYASLDLDNAVADQVRRDKERLVEYRALTRGR